MSLSVSAYDLLHVFVPLLVSFRSAFTPAVSSHVVAMQHYLFTIIKLPSTGGQQPPITVYFIEHRELTKLTHSCLCNPHFVDTQAKRAYSKQLTVFEIRTLIRHLPVFFNPTKSPAPNPMLPNEPSFSVTLFTTDSSPFKPFIRVMTASDSAMFPMVSVHVLDKRFREPSHESAVSDAFCDITPAPCVYSVSIFSYRL